MKDSVNLITLLLMEQSKNHTILTTTLQKTQILSITLNDGQ